MHIFANSGCRETRPAGEGYSRLNVASGKRKGALLNPNNGHARESMRSNGCWMLCASPSPVRTSQVELSGYTGAP